MLCERTIWENFIKRLVFTLLLTCHCISGILYPNEQFRSLNITQLLKSRVLKHDAY